MEGTVVLITGGCRGIGRACGQLLAERGARVVVTSRRPCDESLGGLRVRAMDVRDQGAVKAVFDDVESLLGPIDVLINNAGVGGFGAVESISLTDWKAIIDTNLTGAFVCAREAFGRMKARGGGRIVNIGSIAGHRAIPGNAAYAASKWGLRGLSLTLAEEGASCGIRVSLVSPGAVATDIWEGRDGFDPRDMLDPRDVAETVLDVVRRPLSVRIDEVRLSPPKGVL